MQKKSLIAELENLVKKNNEIYNECKAVSRRYEEAKVLATELQKQIADLEAKMLEKDAEIEGLRSELQSARESVNAELPFDDTDAAAAPNTFSEEMIDVLSNKPSVSAERANTEAVDYGAAVEIASAAIGEIVLQCTEACALFAEKGGSNAKDLVNLALGRTEVFKSEALGIIEESDDISHIVSTLESHKKNTLEYLELLKKQI